MAGRAGRGRGRRGRGRGAAAATPDRAPSPAPPSSSSQGAVCFEFLLRIDDDPLGIKRLPDKFAELVDGDKPAMLQLREASCADCFWPVDVLFDGQGKMYLHTGWDKFAHAHNLAPGCVLNFVYEGDGDMAVKVFDETSCRRHYHVDDSGDDTDS